MSARATRIFLLSVSLALAGYMLVALSPWPSVWLIRLAFAHDAAGRTAALQRHLPAGIRIERDIAYGAEPAARLDIFRPAGPAGGPARPVVLWVHGGAFVAGDKADVAPYLQILAGRGYTVVGVGYERAPAARYPQPVLMVNRALRLLAKQAGPLGIGERGFVLAGDSAGAQIAAQLAAALTAPGYAASLGLIPAVDAQALRGVALFCGVYDATALDAGGLAGHVLSTARWAYFGREDGDSSRKLVEFAVDRHVTEAFPPSFVSAGSGDALAPQSVALAEALAARGVRVDRLFFPHGRTPPLDHEYQFDLDEPAGREALERLDGFLAGLGPHP
jgi:acetyl esterase/lipase